MDSTKGVGRPEPDTPSVKKGKNYVLAIGIDDYMHCPRLHNAVKDAQDFVELLVERYNFDPYNITQLFNSAATSRQILAKFREIAQKVTPDDNLIIYFSGHGEYDKVLEQGFWIPVNAEKGEYDDYLPNSTIRDVLNAIKSHHTFLIADSCFSGALFSSRDANRDIADRREIDPSRWGLTAGRNEIVGDGKPGTNSPFAEKLLDLLRKNDKPLGVAEICAKMMEIVQANADQTPRGEPLKIKGHEGGQFFFHPQHTEETAWRQACEWHNETSYLSYLKAFPNGKYADNAKIAMRDIADTVRWQKAKRENSVIAFWEYLEAFPKGKYVHEATNGLAEFERKNDLNAAKEQAEKARLEHERAERKRIEREKAEADRLEKEKTAKEQAEKEKQEKERLEKAEKERLIKEQTALASTPQYETPSNEIIDNSKAINWQKWLIVASILLLGVLGGVKYFGKTDNSAAASTIQNTATDPFEGQMVFVKGGTFKMGSNDGQDDEKPIHKVTLSDFNIGKYEVTQAQWQAIMGSNPSYFKGDNLPVENVSWDDVQVFLTKLNEKTGKKYRLPTEAEWEFAARGGNNSKGYQYSGSNNLGDVGNNSGNQTQPVGQKQASELGIHDMSGNVWEWCSDWYSNYSSSAVSNPTGATQGSNRVFRGGGWYFSADGCRVAYRFYDSPSLRSDYLGFRLVSSLQ